MTIGLLPFRIPRARFKRQASEPQSLIFQPTAPDMRNRFHLLTTGSPGNGSLYYALSMQRPWLTVINLGYYWQRAARISSEPSRCGEVFL